MTEPRYRLNVAAFVLNAKGEILFCHRADKFGSWQLPQGGIDEKERPEDALLRELREEIGTADIDTLDTLPMTIRYDWPTHLRKRGFCGQEQYYFLVRLRPGAKLRLDADEHQEFDACEWVGAAEFLRRIEGFRAPAYRRALEEFKRRRAAFIAE